MFDTPKLAAGLFIFQLVFVRYAGIAMGNSPALLEHVAYRAATNYTNTEITPKWQRLISANGSAAAGTDLYQALATPPSGIRDELPKHGCRVDPNWDIQPCRRRDDGWNGSTCPPTTMI